MNLVKLTRAYAKEDRKKSWKLFLSTLFLVVLCFYLTYVTSNLILRVLFGVCAGLSFGRLFVIYHDYNHQAILTKSRLAHWLMTAIGIFALAPRSIWNHVHNHHHTHNSQFIEIVLGSFPVLEKKQFKSLSRFGRVKYLFIRHPVTIALSYITVFIISFCLYPFFESPRKHWDGLASFLLHVAASLFIFYVVSPTAWLTGMVLPFTLMGMLGGYVFYAQHNFPGVKLFNNETWNYQQAALASSSYIKMNVFWRWVTANVGYHHVHHVNERIPFYRLPEAMEQIPQFQHPTETSLSWNDIKKCLALKVWDEAAGKMVGLKEAS